MDKQVGTSSTATATTAATVNAGNTPKGAEGPHVGGSSPAAKPEKPPEKPLPRHQSIPVIPCPLAGPDDQPDAFGQLVLRDPATVAALASLAAEGVDVHDVEYDPHYAANGGKGTRIDRQCSVWLTDRRSIIRAGLMHRDEERHWVVQTYPGTKTVYPRKELG